MQLLNFLDPVEQPTARTMTTMISRREGRLRSVFSFEHSGRMRHANEEHGVFAGSRRRFVKSAPGMLLEHVVNVLHARHVALANAVRPLIQPSDRRPQRYTVITNFSFCL